jgi:membrane protease YdiL (CAAX protease family)
MSTTTWPNGDACRSRTRAQAALIGAPVALIGSMYVAFPALVGTLGFPVGYLVAFIVYWLGWCTLAPAALLGWRGVLDLFRSPDRSAGHRVAIHAALWGPVAFPLVFAFIPRVGGLTPATMILSLLLGGVTGTAEELLWRGTYLAAFPDSFWLGAVFPSVAFGLWHLCPLSVMPSRYPGGALPFVAYSTLLGMSYAYCARRSRSIRWCAVAHSIHDTLGLGALVYASWLT